MQTYMHANINTYLHYRPMYVYSYIYVITIKINN